MANRGIVHYAEPEPVTAREDMVSASKTRYLLSCLLTMMNERDSIRRALSSNTGNHVKQLGGIANYSDQVAMETARNNIQSGTPVYASDINVIIRYTNEMINTLGTPNYTYEVLPCEYATPKFEIQQWNEPPKVPDQEMVDPVTGVPILDKNGKPVMIPGFLNPIPVLDSNGDPVRYTITGKIIYQEGPEVDYTKYSTITRCNNPFIACNNRTALWGWRDMTSLDNGKNPVVYSCKDPHRNQIVYSQTPLNAESVKSVSTDEFIKADTFNLIVKNLRTLSNALDKYSYIWGGGGGDCTLNCQLSCQQYCQSVCQTLCQLSCQSVCQLSCQSCHGGTCHNQHCGGL